MRVKEHQIVVDDDGELAQATCGCGWEGSLLPLNRESDIQAEAAFHIERENDG